MIVDTVNPIHHGGSPCSAAYLVERLMHVIPAFRDVSHVHGQGV
jgi:hypothetical protein